MKLLNKLGPYLMKKPCQKANIEKSLNQLVQEQQSQHFYKFLTYISVVQLSQEELYKYQVKYHVTRSYIWRVFYMGM